MIFSEEYWDRLDRHRDEMRARDEQRLMAESAQRARVTAIVGDITTLDVDAIVNAANPRMLGGGGVDGAIHAVAGPELLEACAAVAEVRPGVRCPTGEARMTPGFNLKARHVIHTVGPVWKGHGYEPELLAMCYRFCLKLARQSGLTSIAFPAISTGVYGFPKPLAAEIAVREVRECLDRHDKPERVVFVAFSDADLTHYEAALRGAK